MHIGLGLSEAPTLVSHALFEAMLHQLYTYKD